jgi:hypothetical protein
MERSKLSLLVNTENDMNEEDNFEFKEKQIELQELDQASDLGICIDFSELLEKNGVDYVLARMLPSAKQELKRKIINDYHKRLIDANVGL